MLRAKRITPRTPTRADPSTANPLHAYAAAFIEWGRVVGLTEQTAGIRERAVGYFIRWADERSISDPKHVTCAVLERYQRHLYRYRKPNGQPLALSTQASRLDPVKAFFKWLARERHIPFNPASELIVPKVSGQLPRHIMELAEVERVLAIPNVATLDGIRDRAILEVLYSTGIRRMELANLKLHDVSAAMGTLTVRAGKGGKDRVVPLGARASAWIARYLADVRPLLLSTHDDASLFLTDFGEPFEKNRLGTLVKRYFRRAGVKAVGSCHLFRHACATHMLENGADIRFIQAMLGHAKLTTTEIYTRVSITKLKEIHAATHPGAQARLEGEEGRAVATGASRSSLER